MKQHWPLMSHEDKRIFVTQNLDKSASKIAKLISGASRNAIIGFCHRNKLKLGGDNSGYAHGAVRKKKPEPIDPATVKRRDPVPRVPKKPKPELAAESEMPVPKQMVRGPVSIMRLTERTCKWPLNETYVGLDVDQMMFCGQDKPLENSFCKHHSKLAYVPAMRSKRSPEQRGRAR